MGLFDRVKDLLQANIMDLINQAEDPEKMLNLYVEKASEEVRNFQVQVNRAVADKIQLEERIENLRKEVEQRQEQAGLAVQQGKDDLARTALTLKNQAETSLLDYQAQLTDQTNAVQDLQENLRILTEKLEKARSERSNLIMRQRRAETMKKANESVAGISNEDPMTKFDRMKEKVERSEAEAKASKTMIQTGNSIEDQLADLQKNSAKSEVEDELAQLKAQFKKE